MTVMETTRLILRLLNMDDIDDMMQVWGDNEVMAFCGGAGTVDQELRSLRFYIDMYESSGFSPFAVVLKDSGELIGVCGFNPPNNGCDAELMYHLKKTHWGKGYATEAASACVAYALNHPKIKILGASVDPRNAASMRVLEKLGFDYVGLRFFAPTGQDEPYYMMHC